MSLGADTLVVNGERTTQAPGYAYAPTPYGPQTMGVPNVSPSYPPYLGAPTSVAPGAESVAGFGTAGNNLLATQIAHDHPFNWKVSPVPWAVIGLVVGLIVLKSVHWRETVLEGREGLDLGPAREEASAEA